MNNFLLALFLFAAMIQIPSHLALAEETAVTESGSAADFDSLGGNSILLEKAKALNPQTETSIVQNRVVNRRGRVEFSPEMDSIFGGPTYTKTQSLGLNLNYHVTPRWSVGARYNYFVNQLTPEGDASVSAAETDVAQNPGNPKSQVPAIDYLKSSTMALVNWYPIYGKMNLLDLAVAHFDLYMLAGYGQVQLKSGNSPSMTAGAGIGFWINQNLTSRFEVRYQNFKSQYFDGDKKTDIGLASLQMGWML